MPEITTRIVKIKDGNVLGVINAMDFDKKLHEEPEPEAKAAFAADRAANGKALRRQHARRVIEQRFAPLGLTAEDVAALVGDAEL
jgi:hypothetical protein